jgi:hypothetical protein
MAGGVDGAHLRAEPQAIGFRHCQAHQDEVEVARSGAGKRLRRVAFKRQLQVGQRRLDLGDRARPLVDDEDAAVRILAGRQDLAGIDADRLQGRRPQVELVGDHLQPDQALDPGDQGDLADRLGQEVVGAAFQPLDPVVGLVERRHHDHRHMRRLRSGLERAADFEAVHLRHHHVENDEVYALAPGDFDGLAAAKRRADLEILRRQPRLQQLDVRQNIVDDQDTRRHPSSLQASPI